MHRPSQVRQRHDDHRDVLRATLPTVETTQTNTASYDYVDPQFVLVAHVVPISTRELRTRILGLTGIVGSLACQHRV